MQFMCPNIHGYLWLGTVALGVICGLKLCVLSSAMDVTRIGTLYGNYVDEVFSIISIFSLILFRSLNTQKALILLNNCVFKHAQIGDSKSLSGVPRGQLSFIK